MNRSKRCLTWTVAAVFCGAVLHASERPSFPQFPRALGMGGAFTAVADDHNIFSYNPAGMVQRTGPEVTLLQVAPGVSSDFRKAVEFLSDNEDELTNWETVPADRRKVLIDEITANIIQLNPRLYLAANVASMVSGPSFMGIPAHVGFGLLGVVDASFRMDPPVVIPTISYAVDSDILLPVAVAKRFNAPVGPGKIGFGVTGKAIRRFQVKQERISVFQLDDLESPPMATGAGLGMDLGVLYQPTDRVNVGMKLQDVGGTKIRYSALDAEKGYDAVPKRSGVIEPQTNIGVAVVPERLLWMLPTNDRWTFAMDVRDIFNSDDHLFFQRGLRKPLGENLGTHLYAGAEYRYWMFRFRGGAHQGYPTAGVGIDIPVFKLDYAYYSQELGRRAGDLRQGNHILSAAFRFGSGNVEARERITRAKETRRSRRSAPPTATTAPVVTEAVKPATPVLPEEATEPDAPVVPEAAEPVDTEPDEDVKAEDAGDATDGADTEVIEEPAAP